MFQGYWQRFKYFTLFFLILFESKMFATSLPIKAGNVFQIFQLIQTFTFFLAFHEKVLFYSKRFEVCPQQNLKPLLLHLTVAAVLKTRG